MVVDCMGHEITITKQIVDDGFKTRVYIKPSGGIDLTDADSTTAHFPITDVLDLADCTMLFCPFAVGDEVEVEMPYDSYTSTVTDVWSNRITTADGLTHFQSDVRHASPDLRPAEGYQFNQRAERRGRV